MKALVTGAAGFIGSSLVDRLLEQGSQVIGLDNFSTYYSPEVKKVNLQSAFTNTNFSLIEADLCAVNVDDILSGVTHVFHQAGQPGVRASWGDDFEDYVRANIWATSRLLEASRRSKTLISLVAASSSSVYGRCEVKYASENARPQPISPYGVTKLAAENLCTIYKNEFGLPIISLRYFTVYGPRQRPDMAFSRMLRAIHDRTSFTLFGDGSQRRSFTYIDDIVGANLVAAEHLSKGRECGPVYNVGSPVQHSIIDVIKVIESKTSKSLMVNVKAVSAGDPFETMANTELIAEDLGWQATTPLELGLAHQISSQFE